MTDNEKVYNKGGTIHMNYTMEDGIALYRDKQRALKDQRMKVERLKLKVELTKTKDYFEKIHLKEMISCFDEYFEIGKFDAHKFSEAKINYCKSVTTYGDMIRLYSYQFSVKKTFADKQKVYNKKNRTCNRELAYDILQFYDGGILL